MDHSLCVTLRKTLRPLRLIFFKFLDYVQSLKLMEPASNKLKHDFICALLEKGDAMICLDARSAGVSVPREHKGNHSLNLILSLNFPRPMKIEEEWISATLAFGGRPFACVIPMEAVWAAFHPETGKGQIWSESVPHEVLQKLGSKGVAPAHTQETGKAPLKLVSVQPKEKTDAPDSDKPKPRKGKQKSHLRVIK
jgi:stringent starvation protein B